MVVGDVRCGVVVAVVVGGVDVVVSAVVLDVVGVVCEWLCLLW